MSDDGFVTVTKRARRPKNHPGGVENGDQPSVTSAPKEYFKSGSKGRFARDRTGVTKPAVQEKKCFSCGDAGHMINDCPTKTEKPRREQRERQPVICYNCNQSGHVIRDCPEERKPVQEKKCYGCGGSDHLAFDCPSKPSQPRTARRERNVVECYNCGEQGHISRDCQQERKFQQSGKN